MNCFILASPRSGTTWLKTALNIHPEIYCTERQLFGNYADLLDDYGSVTPRLRCTLDKYISSVLRHHNLHSGKESWSRLMSGIIDLMLEQERAASGKDCLVDKITPYVGTCDIVLRRINEFFPNCKLIYLVRDGRDVAVSGIFNWLQKKQNGSRFTAFQKRRADFFYG
ncbi:sulfotransferase, partial [Candidatus Pacearchaeota archaeon]|nr:sulfotransferase [Candidatus Pacearchaeota archaeon]